MDSDPSPRPSVLVVEDDAELADLYATWLEDDYEVDVVNGGEPALNALHSGIDVVLLDRNMPDVSGDEVLVSLRNQGLDCRVVMVTGVRPDFDVIDLGFDDYLEKPVDSEALNEVVESLYALDSAEKLTIRLSSLRVRRNILQVEKDESELEEDEGYRHLCTQIASLEKRLSDRRDGRVPEPAD